MSGPSFIERDRVEDRLIQGECLDRPKITRALDGDMVAGTNQDLADQVKALL